MLDCMVNLTTSKQKKQFLICFDIQSI